MSKVEKTMKEMRQELMDMGIEINATTKAVLTKLYKKTLAEKKADKEIKVDVTDMTRIFNESWLLNLKMSTWGARAKLRDEDFDGQDIPTEIIRGVQDLLDSDGRDMLEDLKTTRREAKNLIKYYHLPFPIRGLFFVRKMFAAKINDRLKELQAEYFDKREKLADSITDLEQSFRDKYPKYYRPEKYPSRNQILNKFQFNWSFRRLQAPDKAEMMEVSPEIYQDEVNKFRSDMVEMRAKTMQMVGRSFKSRIDSLAKQCENGKVNAKTYNSIDRLMQRFEEVWSDTIGSGELKKTVNEIRKYMAKASVERLKNNDDYREGMGEKLAAVVKKLEVIPEVKGDRSLVF